MGVLGKGRKTGIPIQKNEAEVGVQEVTIKMEENQKKNKRKKEKTERTPNLKLLSLNLNESLTRPA